MPTIGSETKAARIRKGDLEALKPQLKDITFSEWVHRKIYMSGNIPTKEYEELKLTCMMSGVTVERFLMDVCRAINTGEIIYEKGKFVKMDDKND